MSVTYIIAILSLEVGAVNVQQSPINTDFYSFEIDEMFTKLEKIC